MEKDAAPVNSRQRSKHSTYTRGLGSDLKQGRTAIVGQTLDMPTLAYLDLDGTSVRPAMMLEHIKQGGYNYYHVWLAAKLAVENQVKKRVELRTFIRDVMERFVVEIGKAMIGFIPGPHITFVDPRLEDSAAIIAQAKRLVARFEEDGISRRRLVISIPATEHGIAAARELEGAHDIHTNLLFISSLMHAAACSEAQCTMLTIPVGPLLDWYEQKQGAGVQIVDTHPGIEVIQATLKYFNFHGVSTKILGAEFREVSEISALAEFDAVCVSKDQGEELRSCSLPACPIESTSPGALRARQAQFPTKILESKAGIAAAMSSGTRNLARDIMGDGLRRMSTAMLELEKIVGLEAVSQYRRGKLDVSVICRRLTWFDGPPSPPREVSTSPITSEAEPTARRRLARHASMMVIPGQDGQGLRKYGQRASKAGVDDDEVF